ncbi:hypothetical protein [Arthrobacter sp. STN4]|uniref:hypothetical protein n=1 Tax=Arthrobacter sp. STN4 TaxID=2923276 RepID=UPI00211A415B|nr:hypothetical protein [Arthrobacter sp. STN4]MCQ9163642.1 hypothetical protein [Arthrobacter sp. STN4]
MRVDQNDSLIAFSQPLTGYDNAMAEAPNSLFNAELVRNQGPWTGINDLEIAVAEYID